VLDDVNENVETTIIQPPQRWGCGCHVSSALQLDDGDIHLMSSPANASRLMESIAQANSGKTAQRDLIDDQASDLD
jgi:antitoxin YefM